MTSKTQALLGAGSVLLGLTAAMTPGSAFAGVTPAVVAPSSTTADAQMIARAWLDDSYCQSLQAQGIEVPPRPDDIADEELDTSALAATGPAASGHLCDRSAWAAPSNCRAWATPSNCRTWASGSACR